MVPALFVTGELGNAVAQYVCGGDDLSSAGCSNNELMITIDWTGQLDFTASPTTSPPTTMEPTARPTIAPTAAPTSKPTDKATNATDTVSEVSNSPAKFGHFQRALWVS